MASVQNTVFKSQITRLLNVNTSQTPYVPLWTIPMDRDRGTAERLYIMTLKNLRKLAARIDEGASCPWRVDMLPSQRHLPMLMPREVMEAELHLLSQLENELKG